MKIGRGRGSIFMPFSAAELSKPLYGSPKGARGVLKHDKLPDVFPELVDGRRATLVTFRNHDDDFLCTGAAGPPGTMNGDGSRVEIPTAELQRLRKAREDTDTNDSLREGRDQKRRKVAWENGISVPVHSEPYFSDLEE
jgi:hypothetical protein